MDVNKVEQLKKESSASPSRLARPNTAIGWQLLPTLKYSDGGVTRCISPSQTIRRVTPILPLIGVTRVSEVTYLDRVGIPNFMTVRPRDAGPGISYYNGKGTTIEQAHAGALMEAVERYSGEYCDYPIFTGTYADACENARSRGDESIVLSPDELIVPSITPFCSHTMLEWVTGFDLMYHVPAMVPRNAVLCPYRPLFTNTVAIHFASTNGLASGNTLEEALCHALCEVVERDAVALAMTHLQLVPALQALLIEINKGRVKDRSPSGVRFIPDYPTIQLDRLPVRAARLVGKLSRAGIRIVLRDVTGPVGIPTFHCTLFEPDKTGPNDVAMIHGGCGTHPDARVAVIRAITEAAQSRIGCIQGGREDLPMILAGGGQHRKCWPHEEERCASVSFAKLQTFVHPIIDEDIAFLLARLKMAGFNRAIAFDLTRPEIGVPVVRVVVPQAETWPAFHLHTRRGALGPRVRKILEEA
jgi:ribosomal protein S12 methylthiotransferase accessory factor YcaO